MTPRLYIGTAGLAVWYSDDLGETLQRFWGTAPSRRLTEIRALAWVPD
jgi:hypothetical protein